MYHILDFRNLFWMKTDELFYDSNYAISNVVAIQAKLKNKHFLKWCN